MPNYCRIVIAGHLGRDPELKYLNDGKPLAKFSVAVTDKSGGNEQTTWFDCTVFGKQAESVATYLAKGRAALVEGRIRSRQYDAKDGSKKTAWELLADRVVFLGGKNEQQRPAQSTSAREPGDERVPDEDFFS